MDDSLLWEIYKIYYTDIDIDKVSLNIYERNGCVE